MKSQIFISRIFPLLAICAALFAYLFPSPFLFFSDKVVFLLGAIMFFMGTTLSAKDFSFALKRPKAILLGLALQFTLMPTIAFGLSKILNLPSDYTVGMVLVGAVAGGTASNVMAYLAKGNLALSIAMTCCSTLAGIFLTPFITYAILGAKVEVPVLKMFADILCVIALPISLGVLANLFFPRWEGALKRLAPAASTLGIILVIASITALNAKALNGSVFLILCAVILHNGLGLLSGYALCRLFKFDKETAVTIAIEVGMQNSGLAAVLAKNFFALSSAMPAVIFSVWHNISGVLFASFSEKFILKNKDAQKN